MDEAPPAARRTDQEHTGVPPEPHRFVPRSRLAPVLDGLIVGPVHTVTVWGAAGTGKSILLAEWARRLSAEGRSVLWTTGPRLTEVLATGGGADATPGRPGIRYLLVDDLHLAAVAAVEELFLLVQLDPQLRLIAAGRFQPGASRTHLAATGELIELRTDDLAFTIEECESLAVLHGVALDGPVSTALTSRTGGWATGLALAMPVLAGSRDPQRQVEHFAADTRAIGDYLTSEVLANCTTAQRELLIDSALDATVPIELVAAVTGRTDAGAALGALARTLTLVTETADTVGFHPVLLSFLQAEGRHRDLDRAHRRHAEAARWFARVGEGDRALQQATVSADVGLVRELLDVFAVDLVLSGQSAAVLSAVRLVPPAERGLAEAVMQLLIEMPFPDAYHSAALFRQAEAAATASPFSAWSTLLVALQVFATHSASQADALLAELGAPEHASFRAGCLGLELVAAGAEARAAMLRGDTRAALDRYRAVAESAHRAGYDWLSLQISEISATGAITAGDWEEAAGIEDAMVGVATHSSLSILDRARAAATIVSAARAYQTCVPLPVAELEAVVAADSTGRVLGLGVPAQALLLLSAIDAESNPRPAADSLEHLLRSSGRRYPRLVAASLLRLVSIRLELDGRAAARDFAEFAHSVLGHDALESQLARSVLDPPSSARDARESALVAALEHRARSWHAGATVGAWILLAAQAQATSRAADADGRMLTAVTLAKRFRTSRPFLARGHEGARLLESRIGRLGHLDAFALSITERAHALSTSGPDVAPSLHLTAREHDILKELPAHQTLAAIARNQHLSANTVKTHVRSIYQKLGVTERSEAVVTAQRLGLL